MPWNASRLWRLAAGLFGFAHHGQSHRQSAMNHMHRPKVPAMYMCQVQ